VNGFEQWRYRTLGQWHYVLGYSYVLLAHNWPLLLALGLCLWWGGRLYRHPTRSHVCWFFGSVSLAVLYEYHKHVAPTLHASLATVLSREAGWLNGPTNFAVGPLMSLLLVAATAFFFIQALWLGVGSTQQRQVAHSWEPPRTSNDQ